MLSYITVFCTGLAIPIAGDYYGASSCGPTAFEEVPINGSKWIAQKRGIFCGFRRGRDTDISVTSKDRKRTIKVVEGADIRFATMNGAIVKTLIITAPNLSDIKAVVEKTPNLEIVLKFRPADDPAERARYQAWLGDKSNGENRIWYCQHVMALMDEYDRSRNDSYLAYTTRPRPNALDPGSYCDASLKNAMSPP